MMNSSQLVKTKLFQPQVPSDLITRTRLLDRLNSNHENPLILVAAPAGYGKSTLLASWLEQMDYPRAWISLDEQDDDLHQFLIYLVAAIDNLFPGQVNSAAAMLELQQLPPLREIAGLILNDLANIGQRFTVVLDDYQCITKEKIHELVDQFLLYSPKGMQLALATRSDPPLSLVRLRAKGFVTEIRMHDLRFTRSETARFLARLLQTEIDDEDAEIIDHQFEGWVTGLRLAALSMRNADQIDATIDQIQGNSNYVRDYLIFEVSAQLPEAIRHFLVKTSILERLCGPLCDAVVGLDESECDGLAYLEWLRKLNLFIVPLDAKTEWFRYHHLMREYLQQELASEYEAVQISELHDRASTWLAQNGHLDEAILHARKAGKLEAAAQLVARHRHDLIDSDQWHRLERWLGLFDQDMIVGSPDLSIVQAWLHTIHGHWEEVLATLTRTESLLASGEFATEIEQPIQGEMHLLRANILIWSYAGPEVLRHTEMALALLPRQWHFAYTSAYSIDSWGHLFSGEVVRAIKHLQRGLSDPELVGRKQDKSMLMYGLALAYWATLNVGESIRLSRHYLAHGQELSLPQSIAAAQYLLGCGHYLKNDLTAAAEHFSAVVESPYMISLNVQTQAACGLALTHYALGEEHQANEVLDYFQTRQIERRNFRVTSVIKACRAELRLRGGKLNAAIRWAKSYDPEPFVGLNMFYIPQLTLVKVWLTQDTPASRESAARLLHQLAEVANGTHLASAKLPILLAQAQLAQRVGNRNSALKHIQEAVDLAESEQVIRPFVDFGPWLASQLLQLGDQSISQAFVAQIIDAFPSQLPGGSFAGQSVTIESLTARELEVLTLLAQQKRNQDIADELVLTIGTVKQYTHTIYRKLSVKNRRSAVAEASRLGILPAKS